MPHFDAHFRVDAAGSPPAHLPHRTDHSETWRAAGERGVYAGRRGRSARARGFARGGACAPPRSSQRAFKHSLDLGRPPSSALRTPFPALYLQTIAIRTVCGVAGRRGLAGQSGVRQTSVTHSHAPCCASTVPGEPRHDAVTTCVPRVAMTQHRRGSDFAATQHVVSAATLALRRARSHGTRVESCAGGPTP